MTYLASADGTLADFEARQGGYVPGGETMAVITAGRHRLRRRRSSACNRWTTPGSGSAVAPTSSCRTARSLRGKVSAISVETADGIAFATVQVGCRSLR